MRPTTDSPVSANPDHPEPELHRRIAAEFHEMPGLTLTLRQATRLFSLDPVRCERVLGSLVDGGVLVARGGAFMRADVGRHST